MRARQVAAWEAAADDPRKEIAFVLTLSTDGDRHVHFSSRPLEDRADVDGRPVTFSPGLLSDLSGAMVTSDIRSQDSPMPELPEIVVSTDALSVAFGGSMPHNLSGLTCELSMLVDGIGWSDRLVIIGGARIDPFGVVFDEEAASVSLQIEDPLQTGGVLVPDRFFDNDNPPSGWADYLVDGTDGLTYPICYGQIHRMPTKKLYYDTAGAGVHRFMLCRGDIAGTAVTCHRSDDTDFTPAATAAVATDGNLVKFSYIEVTTAEEGTEDVVSVSFEASSGRSASPGYVIRDMIDRWTGFVHDQISDESLANAAEEMSSMRVAILIDGDGQDQSVVSDVIDNRICMCFPVRVVRAGGKMCFTSIAAMIQPEGAGYVDPTLEIRIGDEAELVSRVSQTGPVINDVAVRYRIRNDSGYWDQPRLIASPETDEQSMMSRSDHGLRPSTDLVLEDVYDAATAGAILDVHRALFLDPWYEFRVRVPVRAAWVLPPTKVRIDYSASSFLRDVLVRKRWNLKRDATEHTRDGYIRAVSWGSRWVELDLMC